MNIFVFLAWIVFLLFLAFFLTALCVNFIKDLIFYRKNRWNFDLNRKGSYEIFDGDPGGGGPLSGKRRILGAAIFIFGLACFILLGCLVVLNQFGEHLAEKL